MKILVIGTACWTFEKFRGSLLKKLVSEGNEVIAIGSNHDHNSLEFLQSIGVQYYTVNFDNRKTDIISFLFSAKRFFEIAGNFKPDACLAYFLKPILMATILKFFFKFKLVSLVEGLGRVFLIQNYFMKNASRLLLKYLLSFSDRLIFLNKNDIDELYSKNDAVLSRLHLLRGVGVNLKYYDYTAIKQGNIKFLFLSRLVVEKGLAEFMGAASLVRKNFKNSEFHIYGQLDESSFGKMEENIKEAHEKKILKYGNSIHDVRDVIKECHVLVLPTYYREGLPRCIQESLAIGRPVITTKFSGCSGIIRENYNGVIIEPKNTIQLVNAMKWFILNKDKLQNLSLNCRGTAEKFFNCEYADSLIAETLKKNE